MTYGHIKLVLFVAGGLIAGIWIGLVAWFRMKRIMRARSWPSAPGKILVSKYEVDKSKNTPSLTISYEFKLGTPFQGSTPHLSGSFYWSGRQMREIARKYPAGLYVEVFYDPNNPRINCIERSADSGILALWLASVFCFGGSGIQGLKSGRN